MSETQAIEITLESARRINPWARIGQVIRDANRNRYLVVREFSKSKHPPLDEVPDLGISAPVKRRQIFRTE